MKQIMISLLSFSLLLGGDFLAQEEADISIDSPASGQYVQGQVPVSGSLSVLGYSSYELAFAYDDNPTDTWFMLEPVEADDSEIEPDLASGTESGIVLGFWDTTVLTDGDYQIRLQVFLLDGSSLQTVVGDIRVRNYTPIPTATPPPTPTQVAIIRAPTARLIATALASATPSLPTPTPLPANPIALEDGRILESVGSGAVIVLALFLLFYLLIRLRRE